jgi:hypothetical protein
MNDPNLPLLEAAVRLLWPLLDELVFVGGMCQKSNWTFNLAKRAVITEVGSSHAPFGMNASL